ncbi:MAG TPA: hypothetical protein PKU91_10295, partial [Phycisphaerales bacterium]|nr:hypothetical protein [Phycisphaerales bacterium]
MSRPYFQPGCVTGTGPYGPAITQAHAKTDNAAHATRIPGRSFMLIFSRKRAGIARAKSLYPHPPP